MTIYIQYSVKQHYMMYGTIHRCDMKPYKIAPQTEPKQALAVRRTTVCNYYTMCQCDGMSVFNSTPHSSYLRAAEDSPEESLALLDPTRLRPAAVLHRLRALHTLWRVQLRLTSAAAAHAISAARTRVTQVLKLEVARNRIAGLVLGHHQPHILL